MSLTIWLTLAGSLVASYCDIRTRRIPNWLTGSLAVAAILVHAFAGIHSVAESLAVMVVLTAAGTLVYAMGGIGGGDIKLGIAACGMLGFPLCIPFLLYTAIGGGVLAIAFIVSRRKVRETASRVMLRTMGVSQGVAAGKSETLPYAVAFAFGAILIVLAQSVAPFLRITL
jgi:prepilin peptidase CpaA